MQARRYFRGRADIGGGQVLELSSAFQFLLFASRSSTVLGPSLTNLLYILALSGWGTLRRQW